MSEQLGVKYSNITKLNKRIDLLGYFAGIKKIENDEYRMSSIFLIVSLLLISVAFSISRNTTMDHFLAKCAVNPRPIGRGYKALKNNVF
jgi:hypothetical protein